MTRHRHQQKQVNSLKSCAIRSRALFYAHFGLYNMTFFLVQMGVKVQNKQDMNELIPIRLIWLCPLIFAFGTQLFYLVRNKRIVTFLRKWKELEVDLNSLAN